ncbi:MULTISPECIES: response regulator [unclassified Streptomyces]|uniref:response regulator n=1 Tax=unclassified Streptomyces TaxID=2593676 RepID=UPI002152300B|nr:response regulator [Streptomyces sp. CB02959]
MPGLSGRILVVDDNKVIRQLIRVNLELEGFEVVTAADGAECLDVVHQVRPDVVTLDVVMPRLGGLHTAARLRSDPRTWDIPIAIVSACTQGEVDNGESVGIDAFLAKPFEPTELVRTVGMLVREGRQQRERPGDELRGGCPEGPCAGGGAEGGGAGGRGEAPRGDAAGTGGGASEEAAPGDGVESGGSAGGEPGSGGGRAAG